MKKTNVLLILFFVSLIVSCKQEPGTIKGVVTYYFNDYQGYKPDIGAKVFVTKINCDTIKEYLSVSKDVAFVDELNAIRGIKSHFSDYLSKIKYYAKDSIEYDKKEKLANAQFFNATKSVVNEIYKTSVDGTGRYSIDVPPGEYNVIVVSSGRQNLNLLEINGNIKIERTFVKSKITSNTDVVFEVR